MKIYRFAKKKSQYGFSLIELLVSAGLLGFVGIGVSTLGVNVFKMQRKTIMTSETNEFSSSLGYYLKHSCQDEFVGEIFPYNKGPNTKPLPPLVVDDYTGFGDLSVGQIKTGVEFGDKWKVTSLTWHHKTSVPEQDYKRAGTDYKLVVATISIQSAVMQKEEEGGDVSTTPYHIEIPFLIEPGTNKIEDCMDAKGLRGEDICAAIGGKYNALTETCDPDKNCFVLKQFINCAFDKGKAPTHAPADPCFDLIEPEIGSDYFHYYKQPDTGDCPMGTDMILSGEVYRKGKQKYNKGKNTNTYTASGKVYLCMRCPSP